MIVALRKQTLLLAGGIGLAALMSLAAALGAVSGESAPVSGTAASPRVIIDPGHGGADGGAVAKDGTVESALNLAIALDLEQVLAFAGVPTELTRREDVMLGDPTLPTVRQRKTADLQRRVELTEAAEGAVLISIHQNALPSSPKTYGAQVFYSPHPAAEALAERMQAHLNTAVNTHRAKQARQIPREIYLLAHVTAPAVLVECGFLSNEAETARLNQPDHRMKIAVTIAAGYLGWAAGEEGA